MLVINSRLLDQMGPAEMANLTPVLREFGGLDVAVGGARVLMRRPPDAGPDGRDYRACGERVHEPAP